jgi:endo-1,4-beta-mannosidase
MSGRLFVPPALEGRNVLTDPEAIMWETRFVRYFVERFKSEHCITAWDLGNECNAMGKVESAAAAYAWTSAIVGAIREKDSSRPVISGMHGFTPDGRPEKPWRPQDQGELCDILTTHPYPLWTPHCNVDAVNTFRSVSHATAETLFYRGIGGKPCFVEECGTLGNFISGEKEAAEFLRANLISLRKHHCLGFMWWCAFDQTRLNYAPYDWVSVERELGLFREDRSPKPVVKVIEAFNSEADRLQPTEEHTQRNPGLCVLSGGQDAWGAAYMTYCLAEKAGIDIEFAWAEQKLPDSPLYLLPSVCGTEAISKRRFLELLEKVKQGAVLYISVDNALLHPFEEYAGVHIKSREKDGGQCTVTFPVSKYMVNLYRAYTLHLEPCGAEVLAFDSDNNPVFTVNQYGKGKVFFFALPLETALLTAPHAFDDGNNYSRLYHVLIGGTI